MKIAVMVKDGKLSSEVYSRFGWAKWFIVVDTETDEINVQKNTVDPSASCFGIQTAQNVVELDVEAVITGNIGPNAFTILSTSGIKIFFYQGGAVEEALALLKAGKLKEANGSNVPTHWS